MSLYDRVRDGNGCFPHVWSPTNLWQCFSHTQNCIIIISFRNHPSLFSLIQPVRLYEIIRVVVTFCSLQVITNPIARYSFLHLTSSAHFVRFTLPKISGKALVRLVSVGWKCCHSYTSDLSTSWSATGLTSLCYERSHLVVGFVLICFQHLSAWNTATGRLPLAG